MIEYRLVGLSLWFALDEGRLQDELRAAPEKLRRRWIKLEKKTSTPHAHTHICLA
jgi:hypothetical protein